VSRPVGGGRWIVLLLNQLADLAEGMIRGCIAHFGEQISVVREDAATTPGCEARFVLRVRDRA
jgi:hypothetical protein